MSTPAATVPMQVGGFGGDMGRDRKPESITSCSPSRDEGNKGAGKPEGKKKKEKKMWDEWGSGGSTRPEPALGSKDQRGWTEAAGSEGRGAPRAPGLQAKCTPGRGPK